jgi:hypothetical protein
MTTGTVLAFVFTGVTVPAATIGAIWIEQRMPRLPPAPTRPAHHPRQPAPGRLIRRGQHD